jgi:hypothetical protein
VGDTKIPEPMMQPMMTVQPFSSVISDFNLRSPVLLDFDTSKIKRNDT